MMKGKAWGNTGLRTGELGDIADGCLEVQEWQRLAFRLRSR